MYIQGYLNYHAFQLLNFEVMRAMILEQDDPTVNVHTEHIKRKKKAEGR